MNEYKFIGLWLIMEDTEIYALETEIHLILPYISVFCNFTQFTQLGL